MSRLPNAVQYSVCGWLFRPRGCAMPVCHADRTAKLEKPAIHNIDHPKKKVPSRSMNRSTLERENR